MRIENGGLWWRVWGRAVKCLAYANYFFIDLVKIPNRNNLREEEFILIHCFREFQAIRTETVSP